MPVNLLSPDPASLHAVAGVRLGVARAGIRKPNRDDLVVLALASGSSVAGVFTTNRFCAAPVQVCREHLDSGAGIRALVVNTGNAKSKASKPKTHRKDKRALIIMRHCREPGGRAR